MAFEETETYRKVVDACLAAGFEFSGTSGGGVHVVGSRESIRLVSNALHHSGQIDLYRKAFAEREAALKAEADELRKQNTVMREALGRIKRRGFQCSHAQLPMAMADFAEVMLKEVE